MTNPSETVKKIIEALAVERERVLSVAEDWQPSPVRDTRDIRDAQLLGETLLALGKPTSPDASGDESVRMQSSLGSLSQRHDLLESWRAP